MNIPSITTERLLLRGFEPRDDGTVEFFGARSLIYRYPRATT